MKKFILSVAFVAATTMSFAQVVIGGTTPSPGATLTIDGQGTGGFMLPKVTNAQLNTLAATATDGLLVYCTDCHTTGVYVYNGQFGPIAMDFANDVMSSTGRVWNNKDLGSAQVATSANDVAAYGDLYQWGRAADGHQVRTSTVVATVATSATPGHGDFIAHTDTSGPVYGSWTDFADELNLWQGVNGVNNPCASGYRLPTKAEFEAEAAAFASQDTAGAYGSPLKLITSGLRQYTNGQVISTGVYGRYWTSTVFGAQGAALRFYSTALDYVNEFMANGMTVRCIKN